MSDQSHRGARIPGPTAQSPDRRILELDEALRGVEAATGTVPALGLSRDSTRAGMLRAQALGFDGKMYKGTVIHPLPGVNWYKVQLGAGGGWISACMLSHGPLAPVGPKEVGMAGPNDDVLVFKPQGLNHGFILGVYPAAVSQGSVSCPDWIVQGSRSGLKREEGHAFPIKGLYKGGGVLDWSAQRPGDQTGLEQGFVSPFGPAMTIDDAMVQVRVSEMAGLWATTFDGWVRLAGMQLLIESPVHEESSGDDEGEARYFRGVAAYPHEALGQYKDGQEFTKEFPDKDVQYTGERGKVDLAEGDEDLQPIYRYQEYAGYLGQGHLRLLMKPAKDSGKRKFGDADKDTGLFLESVALDGTYTLLSAKSVHIGKRLGIVVPKQKAVPEAKDGDDGEAENYKFSSLHGDGDEHKIGNIKVEGDEPKSMLRVAAVMDFISYDVNWKALHPFHYHKADYSTPQQGELADLNKVQENISYPADKPFAPDPVAKKLKIDHRYGEVEYFERESFIRWHDDGTVHIGAGAGEEIVLGGGRIKLAAPLGVDVHPGGDFTVLADQIVLRAKGSIDGSSSEKDVRFKAERNMQFLAGNGGRGGILMESKGTGTQQQYKNKYGEDVVSNGVVVKAAGSVCALLGKDLYLRTGGADLGEGDITLDASTGKRRVQVYGREFHTYTTKAVTLNFGPVDKTSTVNRVYYFGDKTMIADAKLLLGGKLIGYNGAGGQAGVIVDGGVYGTKSIATAGVMADKKGMFLGKVPGGFAGTIQSATNAAATAADALKPISETRHQTSIVQKYYQQDQIGDDALIELLQFSFRDPPGGAAQYKTDGLKIPESRWQQFVRFGLASGGSAWTEKAVTCQGQQTYPWPGKKVWKDEQGLLRLSETKMFDASAGRDKDRPGPYEDPTLGDMQPETLDGTYTLIR